MSSDLAIRFEGVGKEYRVGAAISGGHYNYQSLGERLTGALRNPFRAAAGALRRPESDSFWALKDVSFDVRRGEVVGVIGRNGAGKSTLLKILSQITRPTEGQIEVHGRVGSLLEVGTGFHPELTGRENVFLNGAILGMTQREVRAKFDEIVAFSEVERFLDTPVKQYSSGMYTRLAFAVAAHLDPEVLVVDEVLAVGDAEFQKKCLGKMQDVASGGRTVLFVSHNMASIETLCSTAVHLEHGGVVDFGSAQKVTQAYFDSWSTLDGAETGTFDLTERSRKSGHSLVLSRVSLAKLDGVPVNTVAVGEGLRVVIEYSHTEPLSLPSFGVTFVSPLGQKVTWLNSSLNKSVLPNLSSEGCVVCEIPQLNLLPGRWRLNVGCNVRGNQIDMVEDACVLNVVAGDRFVGGLVPTISQALVWTECSWKAAPAS